MPRRTPGDTAGATGEFRAMVDIATLEGTRAALGATEIAAFRNSLRGGIRHRFGNRAEKLVEFDLQPLRSRVRQPAATPEVKPPSVTPPSTITPAPKAAEPPAGGPS